MTIFSIRGSMTALSLALICITGGLTGYMSISTGEAAVDSTKEFYERGLNNTQESRRKGLGLCFDAGTTNAESLAGQLTDKVTDEISTLLVSYLQTPVSTVRQLVHFHQLQAPCWNAEGRSVDCNVHNITWMDNVQMPFLRSLWHDGHALGLTELILYKAPLENNSIDIFLASPFTFYPEYRAKLGLEDGYRQQLKVQWWPSASPEETCSSTMDEAACNSQQQKPPYLTQAAWDAGGANGGGQGGCNWCAAVNPTPAGTPPFRLEKWGSGYCSRDNRCLKGYATANGFKERNLLTLSPMDKYGRRSLGPCIGILDSARNRDAVPWTCPVPDALEKLDASLLRAQNTPEKWGTVSWSPPLAKGPLLSLQAFAGWGHEWQWDLGDSLGKAVGAAIASIDVVGISDFMKDIIKPLANGTALYIVQQDAFKVTEPPVNYVCKDDPNGFARVAGVSCPVLKVLLSCDTDLSVLSSNVRKYTYMYNECPVSCDRCSDDGQGVLVATTRGVAYAEFWLNESSYAKEGLRDKSPINVYDAEDPLIRSHGRYVLGLNTSKGRAYKALSTQGLSDWWYDPTKANATVSTVVGRTKEMPAETGPPVLFWVKVREINDDLGLRLTVVLLTPRDETMKTIDAATEATRVAADEAARVVSDRIAAESKSTDDDKEKSFMTMLIVVLSVCLLLIALAVVFVYSIVQPLVLLGHDMREVATMKLEHVDLEASPSLLKEVASMQSSFRIVVKNLLEYRQYMPQSVLLGSDEDEPDDAEEAASARSDGDLKRSPANSTNQQSRSNASRRRSSGGASVASKVAAAVDKLSDQGLKKKQVTMLTTNLRNWHVLMNDQGDQASHCHAAVMQVQVDVLGPATKAVVETFCGDRLSCSWNAARPCAVHKDNGPGCSLTMQTRMRELMEKYGVDAATSAVGMAVVTGEGRCGNTGCPGMKKFSVFSPSVSLMYGLERLGKAIGVQISCDQWLHRDTTSNFSYRQVEFVSFPKRHTKKINVFELLGRKKVGEEEWMYQMEQSHAGDPYVKWNSLVQAVITQEFEAATALADEVPMALRPVAERFTAAADAQVTLEPVDLPFH